MKQLIFTIFILLLSSQLQAKLSYTKFELVLEADRHYKEAQSAMRRADQICVYLPDYGTNSDISVLIQTTISAIMIPDPKLKIMTIGLALLGNMGVSMFDKYIRVREEFYVAAYHYDMSNFYNELSVYATQKKKINLATKYMFNTIDSLTFAVMMCQCIENDSIKRSVNDIIEEYRSYVIKQFNEEEINTDSLRENAVAFSENIYAIISEVSDPDFRRNLGCYVFSSVNSLMSAIKELKGCNYWIVEADLSVKFPLVFGDYNLHNNTYDIRISY